MSGGGGKGGETTETIKIDPRLTEGGVQALAAALESASIPYTPARAPTIAAFTPAQQAAMGGFNDAAASFGFQKADMEGVNPDPVTNALGMLGYSTGELYDEQVDASVPKRVQKKRRKLVASYKDSADKVRNTSKGPTNPFTSWTQNAEDREATSRSPQDRPTPYWGQPGVEASNNPFGTLGIKPATQPTTPTKTSSKKATKTTSKSGTKQSTNKTPFDSFFSTANQRK